MSGEAVNTDRLAARELESAINTPELLAQHQAINGTKVRTRFPPEPNGYLHVGHAKSMCMNFQLAFEKLGVPEENRETIFRFDDTNPEAESKEYIDSLREDVDWMGWKPVKVTYTSDYFDQLYELALVLIRKGLAYVCHQSKADIEKSREISKANASLIATAAAAGTTVDPSTLGDANSPWRNRTVEENLGEFHRMRTGQYAANEATLRLKMDMNSTNPNMWDQVAYRIKYLPHPHAGDKWCIYPTYDYTHCIIDSLEHIDYSICTLEFETRRESYFWVLQALDLYRPKVYEMSRLNISGTVLSKRKLLKLVNSNYMRGWDDPRMPTIKGLRRRGYSPAIMNAFCRDIGVTRNANTVQYERLAACARAQLNDVSPRVMAVLAPLKVQLVGHDFSDAAANTFEVADYPFDVTRGTHTVTAEEFIYIDRSDFRMEDNSDYFGLAPGKSVQLKYTFIVVCEKVEVDANGEPTLLVCRVQPAGADKPKGSIQWVPASTALPIEARIYNSLFINDEPSDANWEAELNPNSEIVCTTALADPSLRQFATAPEAPVQFERLGFYVVDKDSDIAAGRYVLNLTVTLKDSKPKPAAGAEGGNRSRKEEQAKALAEKQARMNMPPSELFRSQTDLYSAFDADGVPTHDAAGEALSKSAIKKLKKDWEKQKKLYESANPTA